MNNQERELQLFCYQIKAQADRDGKARIKQIGENKENSKNDNRRNFTQH